MLQEATQQPISPIRLTTLPTQRQISIKIPVRLQSHTDIFPPLKVPISNYPRGKAASSFFYTITVKGPEGTASKYRQIPGCRDPAIAGVLYEGVKGAQDTHGDASLSNLLRILGANWEHMHRGSFTTWYRGLRTTTATPVKTNTNDDDDDDNNNNNNNGEMAYTCDARLGKPSQTDCSQLQYSQLGSPSDTITIVGGGPPKILHSGTCTVAISSITTTTTSIVLTWAQIAAAVGTLIEICVDNPLGVARGGMAVAGTQQSLLDLRPGFSSSGGKKGRRRRRRDVSGFDALPRGVNVTVSGPS